MADEKVKKTTAAAPSQNGGGEDWVDVQTDRPAFKAEAFAQRVEGTQTELYKGPPVQGHVLANVTMPPLLDQETGEMRDWNAYVIRATAPTKCMNRSGEPVEVAIGEEFILAETSVIRQVIPAAAANHPTLMLHVKITPLKREPLKNKPKQKMWTYDIKVAKTLVKRDAVFSGSSIIASLMASAPKPAPELGDGRTVETTGEAVS